MESLQLEFNIDDMSEENVKFSTLQKQIDMMNETFGKVRRKLFCEMGELKKLYLSIQKENFELKERLRSLNHQKIEWIYAQNDYLFELKENLS